MKSTEVQNPRCIYTAYVAYYDNVCAWKLATHCVVAVHVKLSAHECSNFFSIQLYIQYLYEERGSGGDLSLVDLFDAGVSGGDAGEI